MNASSHRRLGLTVAAVQGFLALSWTVYVAFLPGLAAKAGLAASAVIVLLMVDQLVFLAADYACGVASDRMLALHTRLGPALAAVTAVSALAFLLLPWAAPQGSAALFIAITLVWTVTSSVLRAPPLNLIGRHAARPAQPMLVALVMLGLGLANAVAPYLTVVLKGQDPRWPFALASAAVVAATLALVAAERALGRERGGGAPAVSAPPAAGANSRGPASLIAAAVLATLGFQIHVFLNSGAQFLRLDRGADLALLAPVFWVGFNLGLWPATRLAARWGPWRVLTGAAVMAALMAALAANAPGLPLLAAAQAGAGLAWGALLATGFSAALALGHTGREGRMSGALSSSLALGTLLRMGLLATGAVATLRATIPQVLDSLPVLLWALAALLLARVAVAQKQRPAKGGPA